jgi:hypothetical protein
MCVNGEVRVSVAKFAEAMSSAVNPSYRAPLPSKALSLAACSASTRNFGMCGRLTKTIVGVYQNL